LPPCPPSSLPPIPQAPPSYSLPVATRPPVAPPPVVTSSPIQTSGYTIQIGAYRVQASAISVMHRLCSYGYNAYILESVQRGERLFRVRVGRYPSKTLARRDASRLQHNGFDTWITPLSS
jgi:cell division septation protein DedD